ncbi:hypothetical protein HK103_000992 [Boothiomyces macroporosus]|uniref:Uncharacterized protein n=1 Tax=Boothiomyces macroporosus TaxID=261099 RepID=A0AAD5UBA8_9FUNG|nr:hypothetical protein HK103_000992 [Boothiomyces macroporosus]
MYKRKSFLVGFDAFPKIDKELTKSTESGGLVSIIILAVLTFLLCVNQDLRIDILDVAQTALAVGRQVKMTPVSYNDLGTTDLSHQLDSHNVNRVGSPHRPAKDTWRNPHQSSSGKLIFILGPLNGCRFQGSFSIAKVEGMFHITALGHGYMGAHTPHEAMNFTHRVDKLSFGRHYPGLVNPLDHTHLSAATNFDNFQYYLGIVPTIYVDKTVTFFGGVLVTNQYAVTEFSHIVDPNKPDALPGIFIKYNLEPISVRVTQQHTGLIQFITRTCGIIGGN